jgi:3-oxoacyl-[acyl-carrier protein] reductase
MRNAPERIVLVTGASGGVSADVAHQLASADTHVIVNYRRTAQPAEALAAAIREAGGHASTLGADITDEAATAAMMDTIAARFGHLDALILNASGGLDLGVDPAHARRLNRDALRRLALLAMPLMPAGGHIVFVTSHQAHFFPNKAVPKGGAALAASQRAGETALYAMRSTFAHAGIHFTVCSGDMIDGTAVVRAAAIANSTHVPSPSGIVYVGRADYLMTA